MLTDLIQGMIERTDLENRQSSVTSVKNIHRLGIEKKILSQALLIIIKHAVKNVTRRERKHTAGVSSQS